MRVYIYNLDCWLSYHRAKRLMFAYHPRPIYINNMYCVSFEDLQYILKHNKCYIHKEHHQHHCKITLACRSLLQKLNQPLYQTFGSVWTTAALYQYISHLNKQQSNEITQTIQQCVKKNGNEENSKRIFLFYPPRYFLITRWRILPSLCMVWMVWCIWCIWRNVCIHITKV